MESQTGGDPTPLSYRRRGMSLARYRLSEIELVPQCNFLTGRNRSLKIGSRL